MHQLRCARFDRSGENARRVGELLRLASHERLVSERFARSQIDDRLVDDEELLLLRDFFDRARRRHAPRRRLRRGTAGARTYGSMTRIRAQKERLSRNGYE